MLNYGILWINARNLLYIRKFNDKKSIRLADDKIATKEFLQSRDIPVGITFANISTREQLSDFDFEKIPSDHFVIKPNKGSQGKGIQIVTRIPSGNEGVAARYEIQGKTHSDGSLRYMMRDIIDGKYSITGNSDSVLIEEKLVPNADFSKYCDYGLADIRIIVFNLVPVAAMLRMPTEASWGKANLARGGIGLWLGVATGTVEKFLREKRVFRGSFPTGYERLFGDRLPYWDLILQYSSKIQFYTNLGYLALDWVITTEGPKLLEMNARAGLEVQNANILPLRRRLEQVSNLVVTDPDKGVEITKTLFDTGTHEAIRQKKLYLREMASVPGESWNVEIELRIDLGRSGNAASPELAKILKQPVRIDIPKRGVAISGIRYETDDSLGSNVFLLGKTGVQWYFIEPKDHIVPPIPTGKNTRENSLREIDSEIYAIGKKINLSKILRPKNAFAELDTFINLRGAYDPVFAYDFPTPAMLESFSERLRIVRDRLHALGIKRDMSHLLSEKLDELAIKNELLNAYLRQDPSAIDKYNSLLFWKIDKELLMASKKRLRERYLEESAPDEILWNEALKERIAQYLRDAGLEPVPIRFDSTLLSRIAVKFNPEWPYVSISPHTRISDREIASVLNHEIGVHLRRHVNGKSTGWELLTHGTWFYLNDEEWLAIYHSLEGLDPAIQKDGMYKKYVLCDAAKDRKFSKLAELAQSFEPKSLERVFNGCLRAKKGIVRTSETLGCCYQKDVVYLNGYSDVSEWIAQWGDEARLYQGKIKISDLPFLPQQLYPTGNQFPLGIALLEE